MVLIRIDQKSCIFLFKFRHLCWTNSTRTFLKSIRFCFSKETKKFRNFDESWSIEHKSTEQKFVMLKKSWKFQTWWKANWPRREKVVFLNNNVNMMILVDYTRLTMSWESRYYLVKGKSLNIDRFSFVDLRFFSVTDFWIIATNSIKLIIVRGVENFSSLNRITTSSVSFYTNLVFIQLIIH